mmetsp:Transcript_111178/g.265304  ORF Transcript_111178/g.265304 Transcript_111178/m.265304 type:complete len:230 (+) Transcript_111178:3713-4402(+)
MYQTSGGFVHLLVVSVLVHVELGAGQALGLAEEGHGQAATKPLVQAATDVVVDATQHDVAERQRGEDRHSHEQGLPQVWQDAVLVVVALDPLEVAQGLLYQEHRVGLSHDDLQGHDAHEIQHGLHSVDTDDDPGQAGAELPDAVHFLLPKLLKVGRALPGLHLLATHLWQIASADSGVSCVLRVPPASHPGAGPGDGQPAKPAFLPRLFFHVDLGHLLAARSQILHLLV